MSLNSRLESDDKEEEGARTASFWKESTWWQTKWTTFVLARASALQVYFADQKQPPPRRVIKGL